MMFNEKVLRLMKKYPSIEPHKFIRYNGKPITSSPSLEALMRENFTYAVGVLARTPLFIGDKLTYKGTAIVELMSVIHEDNEEDLFNFRTGRCSPGPEPHFEVIVTERLLDDFLSTAPIIDRLVCIILFTSEGLELRFNQPGINRSPHQPIEFRDSRGRSYWLDSKKTVDTLQSALQEITDSILANLASNGNIRVLSSSNSVATIKRM